MSLIDKIYTAKDMRAAAKCLFACEVDLKHDNRDISRMLRQAADMMDRADSETAAKRERESTREKSSVGGNAAAMRETLLRCDAIAQLPEIREYVIVKDMRNLIKKALAAPPRNCDVGTADEQAERHKRWCDLQSIKDCWGVDCRKCFAKWSRIPYKAGGAK